MCGRFTQTAPWEKIAEEFDAERNPNEDFKPRYNIAPTQDIAAVMDSGNARVVSFLRWGLIPSWAKDESIGSKLINARAETLAEKPSFRNAFRSRRCIIPATGFYEWQNTGKGAKQPFYFHLKEKEIFGFAGLWEEWLDKQTGELLETCTIITTEANEVLKPVHERMPVILKTENYARWLDPKEKDVEKLQEMLAPYPAEEMTAHPVSRSVNIATADSPDLIKPLNSL